ncbi:hypothetical protein B7494_g3857 [Chlorociboria aeruginascens]|nr:hypothetical protein B7494_g3857 [Chlorociboria aeruginascens]
MTTRSPRVGFCRCSRPDPHFSSALLFLSLILPSSFAQITPPTTLSPTTLSTSILPSSASSTPTRTQTNLDEDPTSTPISNTDNGAIHVYKYYFLIIAGAVLLLCLTILLVGRRKKRKAELMRSRGQTALARDVDRWRGIFGVGRNGSRNNMQEPRETLEGLDDRGEAPPPYVPGTKPPSIRSVEHRSSIEHREGREAQESGLPSAETVELRRLSGPPKYDESEEGSSGVRRPDTAITASERYGSTRRLLSHTTSSSHAEIGTGI